MNEMQVFTNPEFGKIRTLEIKGEPWLVGKDVATALGYSNTKKALIDHVDTEDKQQGDGVTIRDPMGRIQHPTIINESGLYSLILSSKLPQCQEVQTMGYIGGTSSHPKDRGIHNAFCQIPGMLTCENEGADRG